MPAPIIVHVHIYKNAGTSIIAAFRRNFGDRVAEIEPAAADGMLDARTIEDYLRRRPDTVMISSHRVFLPLPARLAGRDVLPLIFLRDPIDRLSSVYRYERREGQKGALAALSRTTDFRGLVSTLLRTGLASTIANVQSRHVGSPDALAADALLGLVEGYTDSMALIERRLRRWYRKCDLAGALENVTRRPAQVESDVRRSLQELGPGLVGRLLALNAADIDLYRFFAERIAAQSQDTTSAQYFKEFRNRERPLNANRASHEGSDCPSVMLHETGIDALESTGSDGGDRVASDAGRAEFAVRYEAAEEGLVDASGTIAIRGFRFACACGEGLPILCPQETVRFEMTVEWLRPVASPVVGFTIRDRTGTVVWCMNTFWTKAPLASVEEPQTCVYGFTCPLPPLIGGLYTIDVDTALGVAGSVRMLVSRRDAAAFGVAAHYDPVPGGVIFVRDVDLEQRRMH